MTSRIRRIFLIDGRVSGENSSNAINNVDPRGCAAITGANGVGKTTTLHLIPLFFAALPNRIVQHTTSRARSVASADQGVDPPKPRGRSKSGTKRPMLDYVLPNATSAIAYEYQRGDSPDDVVLLTIRRNADGTPEYRFFRSEFREEFFIEPYGENGAMRLLTDAESVQAASRLKVVVEAKLTASLYRSVILRARHAGKDAELVKRLSRQYSYAHRSLHNMNLIMEAIAKEKVDFKDLTAVAVAVVNEELGGEKGKKLQLKSMREQMELWIANRAACESAHSMTDRVAALRTEIDVHTRQDRILRSFSADLKLLAAHREESKALHDRRLEELREGRDAAKVKEEAELAEVSGLLSHAQARLTELTTELAAATSRYDYFTKNDAAQWVDRVKELPTLEGQVIQVKGALRLAKSQADDITRELEDEISRMKEVIAQELDRIESTKAEPNEKYAQAVAHLSEIERTQREALSARHKEALETISCLIEEAVRKLENAKIRSQMQGDSQEDMDRLRLSEAQLSDASAYLEASRRSEAQARENVLLARGAFNDAQHAQRGAAQSLTAATRELDEVTLNHTPKAGSFLASLNAHPDDGWRNTIARIISKDLLNRTDLVPVAPTGEEGADSLYGWRISVDEIKTPAWANLELLQQQLAQKTSAVAAGKEMLAKADAVLEDAAKAMRLATEAHTESQAVTSIALSRVEQQKAAVEDARRIMSSKRQQAAATARAEVTSLESDLQQRRQERSVAQSQQQTQSKALADDLARQRATIEDARRDAIDTIDRQKNSYRIERESAIQRLLAERDRRLKESGVDTQHVQALQRQIVDIDARIFELNAKLSMVQDYEVWLRDGGEARLAQLQRNHEEAKKTERQMKTTRANLAQAHDGAERSFKAEQSSLESKLTDLRSDAEKLILLAERLSAFPSLGPVISTIPADTPVSQLEGQVSSELLKHQRQYDEVSKEVRSIENKLVSGRNAVSALVSSYLDENCAGKDYGMADRGRVLGEVFDKITDQVVVGLNTEFSIIIENLANFNEAIMRFEAGVKEFDKRLQDGIARVVGNFDRFKDFKINIVTQFSQVEVFQQIQGMKSITEESRLKSYMSVDRTIPDKSMSEKLRAVINTIGDGQYELDLSQYIALRGSVVEGGIFKSFEDEEGLASLSSTGITAIAMITLLAGMINVIRGTDPIYIPWATDEIGRFDASNFAHLLQMLKDNRIDVLTGSPQLTSGAYEYFAHLYLFEPNSMWSIFVGNTSLLEEVNRTVIENQEELMGEEQ